MRLLWAEMVLMKTLSVSLVCVGPRNAKTKRIKLIFVRMFFFPNSLSLLLHSHLCFYINLSTCIHELNLVTINSDLKLMHSIKHIDIFVAWL